MAIAFHLLAHRHPAQVKRLLRALWHPENTYVIHYDRRRPSAEHAEIKALADGRDNVFIQPPTPVLWGRFSLYAAQHNGLRIALESRRNWTHWFNVSGQCFPLLSPTAMHSACAEAGQISFVRHFAPLVKGDWHDPADRLTGFYLDNPALEYVLRMRGIGHRLRGWCFGGKNSIPRIPFIKRPLPTSFTWYGADNWVTLSRQAGEYLVNSPESARIISALRRSALPEESIFQSVLLNSPLASSIQNSHRRFIKWEGGRGSPEAFNPSDFDQLASAAASGVWLARKFLADAPVLDRIESDLLSRQ